MTTHKNQESYSLLVVDDEDRARRHILEDINWGTLNVGPIYEASDGRIALEMLRRYHPDLMILDIRMPHLDGVGLLDLLTQTDSTDTPSGPRSKAGWLRGNLPMVIALSGYSDFEAARRMLSSGIVVEYLLKPASEDQLFEAVYKGIERLDIRRCVQENREDESEDEASPANEVANRRPNGIANRHNTMTNPAQIAIIQDVKKYIDQNYPKKLTLNMAADQVHINSSYLSRLFNEVEGIGFSDYLCRVRIDRAKQLLQDYHLKIYEVSDAVGYQDVKHFLKVFKKQTGMTPSEYREQSLMMF